MGAHCTSAADNFSPREAYSSPAPQPWAVHAHSGEDDISVMRSSHRPPLQAEPTPDMPYILNSDPASSTPDKLHVPEEDDTVPGVYVSEQRAFDDQTLAKRLKATDQFVDFSEVQMGRTLLTTKTSKVFRATWKQHKVVAKFVATDLEPKHDANSIEVAFISTQEILHEIEILSEVQHPCVVSFLGANTGNPMSFILLEYMEGGDVDTYMRTQSATSGKGVYKPSLGLGVQWCTSTAKALSFLHGLRRQIIHRDLKPLNLLLSRNLELKVADFGISKVITCEDAEPAPKMSGGVGTWRYMAPEVVRYQQYTDRIDIYSFSLIMYYIFTGTQPFQEFCKSEPELILKAYLAGKEPRPELSSSVATEDLRNLMQASWAIQPSARPSARECVEILEALAA